VVTNSFFISDDRAPGENVSESLEVPNWGNGLFEPDSGADRFASVSPLRENSLLHEETGVGTLEEHRGKSDSLSALIAGLERSVVSRKQERILLALNDFLQQRDKKNRLLSILAQRQVLGHPFPFIHQEDSHYAGLNPLSIRSTLGDDFLTGLD
jgi:hypothetical protein